LNLENIVDGITSYKLIYVIVCFLIIFGGLIKVNIVNKVVCFEGNDVTMFQGLKKGVIVELMVKHSPYIVNIHCMAHQCNLIIQTSFP
jgi:hypothetical protein